MAGNLAGPNARIRGAAELSGRTDTDVRLVLIAKTIEPERVRQAIGAGQRGLGETRSRKVAGSRGSAGEALWGVEHRVEVSLRFVEFGLFGVEYRLGAIHLLLRGIPS